MPKSSPFTLAAAAFVAACLASLFPATAQAKAGLEVIYQSESAGDPLLGTIASSDGSVFVVQPLGKNGDGQIVLLTPNGKKYTATVIEAFDCVNAPLDGSRPSGVLVADAAGNVWGTNNAGCGNGNAPAGTIFELVKPAKGGNWTFKTVIDMPASIGNLDVAFTTYEGMAFDDTGNLFGLVALGCNAQDGCGRIFKVPAKVLGGNDKNGKVNVLYTFAPTPGNVPNGLVRDKHGNLFGTIPNEGTNSYGSVWEASPPATKKGAWTENDIYQFCQAQNCPDGQNPYGNLAIDKKGSIYGTTLNGGNYPLGYGTVWKMTPTEKGTSWAFNTLHIFSNPGTQQCTATTDWGVEHPSWSKVLDSKGNLVTLVQYGGYYAACSDQQSSIYGGVMSVNPADGSDSVVSSQFGASNVQSGPFNIESGLSVLGNTLFGTSSQYYDAPTNTYSAGVVFKIMQ